ncbi:hypothetical protein GCM10011344_38180 [Dokdonia pacifica]|uniref:Lipoprotein n=1 Tax=Dokdonia pacifica TaxID=1627892 RepID=A0A239B5T1_9FLAO|nr:DUF6452 family protein [Dokdonia pacifica]GGG33728.1 hypothetical protein GCM10011344_38180 [Dokdonia pacifica]SNS03265.1 hypothetical protein SAMN06265376_105367 [Dokdonia pacifica]
MTKRLFIIGTVLWGCIMLSSCERDDICAEATPVTPLLIIDFFDIENPTEPKTPVDLTIREVNGDTLDGSPFNTSTVSIPLRTNQDQTDLLFVLNTGSEELETPENIDGLSINYVRIEEYISKACGFRITYDALDATPSSQDGEFWIQDVIIINTTVEDETSAHIQIFH